MCLYIRDIQKQVATKPLKVYKLLSIDDTPPFYPMYAYHTGINRPESQPYMASMDKYWIGAGYLHVYTDKEWAMSAAKSITWGPEKGTVKYKIVEMYIPQGTAYYWSYPFHEAAAEALEWRPESPVEIGEVEYIDEDLPF